jgi:biotin carboxyl carrier protein
MENELRAPRPGRVLETAVREGQAVETGALLVVLE